jgi:hypothetical protein
MQNQPPNPYWEAQRLRKDVRVLRILLIISVIVNAILLLLVVAPSQSPTQEQFVGSSQSDVYHYPDCPYAQDFHLGNEVWFEDSEGTRAHGYHPCGYCDPP